VGLGDAATGPEVAAESAVLVEQRLRAEREPKLAAAVSKALDLEVLERLVALDLGAVAVPIGLRKVERGLVPAPCAEVQGEVDPRVLAEAARHVSQTKLRVLDPEPVARKRAEPAQRIVASARRRFRAIGHWLLVLCTGLVLRRFCISRMRH